MLNKLSQRNIAFKSDFQELPDTTTLLDGKYTTPESRAKTVTILGRSKSIPSSEVILESMDLASKITKDLILSGRNVQTGCAVGGVMGSVHHTAKKYSVKDIATGRPLQNLAIIMEPPYGDEAVEECISIGTSKSEAERVKGFIKTSDTFVVFPGGLHTNEEIDRLIYHNEHLSNGEKLKKVILVNVRNFFAPKVQALKNQFDAKFLNHTPEELCTLINPSKQEILNAVYKFNKTFKTFAK